MRILRITWLPLLIVFAGALLNRLVIILNGGMPVPSLNETWEKWTVLDSSTKLGFLGDVLPGYYSIGDVLMAAGLILLLIFVLNRRQYDRKIKSNY